MSKTFDWQQILVLFLFFTIIAVYFYHFSSYTYFFNFKPCFLKFLYFDPKFYFLYVLVFKIEREKRVIRK